MAFLLIVWINEGGLVGWLDGYLILFIFDDDGYMFVILLVLFWFAVVSAADVCWIVVLKNWIEKLFLDQSNEIEVVDIYMYYFINIFNYN